MSATSRGTGVRRLAVVGAGLIGGSIALAARGAGVEHVRLTDHDPSVRDRARELGLAEEVTETIAAAAAGADLVIAAVPAVFVPSVLAEAALAAPPEAVLTDAASLKGPVTLRVRRRLREVGVDPGRYVGGHPMAGSERSGPDAAEPGLFHGATWVLTPTPATTDEVLHEVSSFLRRLGARVLALSPERHDELVAIVSHLPQIVASTLASIAADAVEDAGDAVLAVAAGGFRDTTRIAASDPALWTPILRGNRTAALQALDAYARRLDELRAAIGGEDWETVTGILLRGRDARRRLVSKPDEATFVDLVVPLEDRPGALAAATTALGELGVNVEDVAMRHAEEGTRGALLLRIAGAAAGPAISALEAHGFRAYLDDSSAVAENS